MTGNTKNKKTKGVAGKDLKELERRIDELQKENRMLLEQQKALVDEERRKLLLQLSGATAHELNQPLTSILGNIELMRLQKNYPKELDERLKNIEEAGRKMADMIRRIQTIRRDETVPYVLDAQIINLDQKINILVVEGTGSDFKKIESITRNQSNISMSRVEGTEKAIGVLKKGLIDLVLLDYTLSDSASFELLCAVRRDEIEVPVIVIGGQGNDAAASKFIQEGAYDYIPRQMLSRRSLSRSIMNAMEKHLLKRDMKKAVKKLSEMSTRDELTGLYNLRYCVEALGHEMARSKRYHTDLSFCIIDIDHFKKIRETYGHQAGDMALSEVGILLGGGVRESDIPCHCGGEKFAVILINTSLDNAVRLSGRFTEKLASHEFRYGSSTFRLTASVGIASFDKTLERSATELFKKAENALGQSKKRDRNRIVAIR